MKNVLPIMFGLYLGLSIGTIYVIPVVEKRTIKYCIEDFKSCKIEYNYIKQQNPKSK